MPFSAEYRNQTGIATVVLSDTNCKCLAEVIPSCGAILHAFGIRHNGAFLDVIDHYADADDFKKNCTEKGFRGCKLSPFVCRLKNGCYRYGGQVHNIGKFTLGGHALHGLLYDADFSIVTLDACESGASVVLKHEYREGDPGYPFRYDCVITYSLGSGNHLTVATEVTNLGKTPIPVADGWHPYFTLGGKIDELQLQFQSKGIMEFDTELIPTGKILPYDGYVSLTKIGDAVFDSCFVLNFSERQPLCVIRNPLQKIQVEIRPDWSYPYLQLYTPQHRQSIAIENLSAAPDAFNNGMGLLTLQPGASATFTTSYTISCLP